MFVNNAQSMVLIVDDQNSSRHPEEKTKPTGARRLMNYEIKLRPFCRAVLDLKFLVEATVTLKKDKANREREHG